jgi:hypothetical protein
MRKFLSKNYYYNCKKNRLKNNLSDLNEVLKAIKNISTRRVKINRESINVNITDNIAIVDLVNELNENNSNAPGWSEKKLIRRLSKLDIILTENIEVKSTIEQLENKIRELENKLRRYFGFVGFIAMIKTFLKRLVLKE